MNHMFWLWSWNHAGCSQESSLLELLLLRFLGLLGFLGLLKALAFLLVFGLLEPKSWSAAIAIAPNNKSSIIQIF